jgi:hypothetical protein
MVHSCYTNAWAWENISSEVSGKLLYLAHAYREADDLKPVYINTGAAQTH